MAGDGDWVRRGWRSSMVLRTPANAEWPDNVQEVIPQVGIGGSAQIRLLRIHLARVS